MAEQSSRTLCRRPIRSPDDEDVHDRPPDGEVVRGRDPGSPSLRPRGLGGQVLGEAMVDGGRLLPGGPPASIILASRKHEESVAKTRRGLDAGRSSGSRQVWRPMKGV